MKRQLVKLALLVLAGAILNITVAWGCVLVSVLGPPPLNVQRYTYQTSSDSGSPQISGPFSGRYGALPQLELAQSFGASGVGLQILRCVSQKYDERGILVYWIDDHWVNAVDVPDFVSQEYKLLWYSAGLPCRSMQGGEWLIEDFPLIDISPTWHLQTGLWFRGKRPANAVPLQSCKFIPLRPVWPGFAINTIFYATILWVLFAAPFQFRRYRRIKHGQCPACAYPVGSSDVCTECGKPVKA